MSDLISRQDAIDAICTWDKFGIDERNRVVRWHEGLEPYVKLRDVVWAIEKLPSAERKGTWIKLDMHRGMEQYKCSACNSECYVPECMGEPLYMFCPICGADMRGEEDV